MANSGGRDISVVSVLLRREVRRITLPAGRFDDRAWSIAMATAGTAVVGTKSADIYTSARVLRLDVNTGTASELLSLEEVAEVEASGDRSWIAVFESSPSIYPSARVYLYSPATGAMVGPTNAPYPPSSLAVDESGSRLVVNPGTFVLDGSLTIRPESANGSGHVVFDSTGTSVYQVSHDSLEVVDLVRSEVDRTIALPEAAGRIDLSPDGTSLALLTVHGLMLVPTEVQAQKSAYAVWAQPTSATLDAVGTWVVPTNVPVAASGQLPPSYLYAHYFNFTQSPSALGVIGLVTSGGTKLVAFGIVDGAGTPHSVGLAFDWVANHAYYLFVAQLNPSSFGGWVYDDTAGAWTFLGQIDLPVPLGKIAPATVTQVIWFGPSGSTCSVYPAADAYFHPPVGYAGGGIALATITASGAGASGTCPATATTEVTPWIHLHLGASLA